MVAKKILKKPTPSKNAKQEESDEEDYEVADLSAIPAPQVEFVMPSLTPLESGKVSKVDKPKRTAKKKAPRDSGDVLTANELNNEIVRLRPVVQKARGFLTTRLIRKLKRMETILAKKPSEPLKRKIQRFEEEIHAIKDLSKDEVTKFALLNKKTLDQLGITDKTSAKDRCLFKLVCEPHVVKAVEEYRAKYPSWEVTTAYLLQRLGLQYASIDKATEKLLHASLAPDSGVADGEDSQKVAANATPTSSKLEKGAKVKKAAEGLKKAQKESEESDGSDAESSDEVGDIEESSGSGEEDEEESDNNDDEEEEEDIEFGSDSNDDEEQAAANRRKLLLGSAEKSRVSPKAKKRPNEDKSAKKGLKRPAKAAKIEPPPTVVVKQVKLSEGGKIEVAKPTVAAVKAPVEIPQDDDEEEEEEGHSSFFLPASTAVKLDRERSEAKKSDVTGNASPKHKKAKLAKGKTGELMLKKKKKKKLGMKGGKLNKHEKVPPVHNKLKPAGESTGKSAPKTSDGGTNPFLKSKKAPMSKNKESFMKPKKVVGKNDGKVNKWEKISLHKPLAHVKAKQPQDSIDQLHPSWAARRLAKEKQGLAPQGKRIVFGDD